MVTSAFLVIFDQVFSDVNTLEKQAKYNQGEQKHSFQPSWQLKQNIILKGGT